MAYSDYGGYAYRSGVYVPDRSDCVIMPDGDLYSSPGQYPGYAMAMAGVEHDTAWPKAHVILGDGPLYVLLYKQTTVRTYLGFDEVDLIPRVRLKYPDAVRKFSHSDRCYIEEVWFMKRREPCAVGIYDHNIKIYWKHEDNLYQYVRLEQPDGVVWHGWSGYGVGAGLEKCGYGYSTLEREETLLRIWPDAIVSGGENGSEVPNDQPTMSL
jgi:hypothetical protein